MTSVAPFLIFMTGAVLVALSRGTLRSVILLAIPLVGAFNLLQIDPGSYDSFSLLGHTLTLTRVDKLSLIFGYLFHLAAFLAIIFSLHVRDTIQHVSGVVYAGSALGAVFAGDMVTLFVFWELLAVSSVFLIPGQ